MASFRNDATPKEPGEYSPHACILQGRLSKVNQLSSHTCPTHTVGEVQGCPSFSAS